VPHMLNPQFAHTRDLGTLMPLLNGNSRVTPRSCSKPTTRSIASCSDSFRPSNHSLNSSVTMISVAMYINIDATHYRVKSIFMETPNVIRQIGISGHVFQIRRRGPHVNFCCFDVETANESASSICQIEIATFIEGRQTYPMHNYPATHYTPISPPESARSGLAIRSSSRSRTWLFANLLKRNIAGSSIWSALSVSVEFEAVLDIRTSATIEAKLPSRATALVLGAG